MSLWRQVRRGLRVLINRRAADQEIADELEHYLAESGARFEAAGLAASEARLRARRELDGSASAIREHVRSYGWESRIDGILTDLRYAARRLRNNSAFTALSIFILALGTGASTAMFTVIDGVLLQPLPYAHSERLVALLHTAPGINIKELNLAASLYLTYLDENRVFQEVGMYSGDSWTITGLGRPEQVPGLSVSHRFLNTLDVRPVLGRNFRLSDESPDSDRAVMLSYGYWESHFAGDPSVMGKRLLLDGNPASIIGVLPASFEFMDRQISVLAPLRFRRADIRLISFCCQGIARLKRGATLEEANADVARMLPIAAERFPLNPGWTRTAFVDARISPRLRPLKDVLVGDIGNTLWVLMGTVGIVLLIACANVANLQLVRVDGRQEELTLRVALGAGWSRIARDLLLESLLLGGCAAAVGLALAYGALWLFVDTDWIHLPRIHSVAIGTQSVIFTICLAVTASLLFGLVPVFRYARPYLASGLRSRSRSATLSKERHRARGVLVALQVALAFVLLVGAGLMLRSLALLRQLDPGFSNPALLQTIRIGISDAQAKPAERVVRKEEEILRKLQTVAGALTVAAISDLPLEGGGNDPVFAEDKQYMEGSIRPIRRFKFISPGCFAALGSRFTAGRDLTWNELYNRTPVALVSDNMARELWGNPHAAIGKRIRVTLKDDWREVIGVVTDMRDNGVDQPPPTTVYWPLLLNKFESENELAIHNIVYLIRSPRAGSSAFVRELQAAVNSVAPTLPMAQVKTLDAVYQESLSRTSFTLLLLTIAGGMALLLGIVGIYAVISYSVAQRTREVGIRLALGASIKEIVHAFLREGLLMCALGTTFGFAAALLGTRLMKSLLYQISPTDPVTYLLTMVALLVAAAAGSYLPARRAARVDPAETLRAQ